MQKYNRADPEELRMFLKRREDAFREHLGSILTRRAALFKEQTRANINKSDFIASTRRRKPGA